jgi:tetraacyldisaccharide 4'-kinase
MPLDIAILSRGYGRKTKGYRRVTHLESAESVGDEPLEIYHAINQTAGKIQNENSNRILSNENSTLSSLSKAKDLSQNNQSPVFVCEDRILGISNIQQANPNINMVLLDDGFQHLKLSALGNIVLTKYQKPFSQDMPLPAGNLREFPHASKNADIILVTHSPNNLSLTDANKWKAKLNRQLGFWGIKPGSAKCVNDIYFASYFTTAPIEQSSLYGYSTDGKRLGKEKKIILITGVADASGIANALNEYSIFHHFEYADHHLFSTSDLTTWQKKYNQSLQSKDIDSPSTNQDENNCVFVCTRKDYMRIMSLCKADSNSANFSNLPFYVCHSEIEILFNEKHQLLNKILTRKLND